MGRGPWNAEPCRWRRFQARGGADRWRAWLAAWIQVNTGRCRKQDVRLAPEGHQKAEKDAVPDLVSV